MTNFVREIPVNHTAQRQRRGATQKPVKYAKPTWSNTNGGTTYSPTHPELFRVEFQPGNDAETYSSRLVAVKDFAPNTNITSITGTSPAEEKAYSSVQIGPDVHIELNSDLLFMNHSCDPSVEVVLPGNPEEWCIRATARGLKAGDALSFFYPSTEWDMAQGFECTCGSKDCLGEVRGANYLTLQQLKSRGYVNEHIEKMKVQQSNGH